MSCPTCGASLPEGAAFCPRCASRIPGAKECEDYAYEAFISYRHAPRDRRIARRIQRRIEGYHIPKELAGTGRRRLGKCFRDEDELSTSDSLSSHIEDALRRSRYLVVVCSPQTRSSRWVDREVELFSSYHGRDKVLLVLADGEPSEAFPPLLATLTVREGDELSVKEAEPVAADLRPASRKRFSDEALRVVAPIVGCAYDDLRQRERARNMRRAVATACAVDAVATSFAAYALFQQAQIEANYTEALRNQSEYLAEEATTLLKAGDRMQAIQVALYALGEGAGAVTDRPYVPSARVALEEACQVYPGSYWRPLYSNKESAGVSDALVSPDGSLYAALLLDDSVRIYDTSTGRALATIAPAPSGHRSDALLLDEGVLCLDYDGGVRTLTLHDARTGSLLWSREVDWDASSLTLSPNGSLLSTYGNLISDDGVATVAVLSPKDGTTVVGADDLPLSEKDEGPSPFLPANDATFSEDGKTLVQAVGSTLWILDVEDGSWRSAPGGVGVITSVNVAEETLYVGGFEELEGGSECVVSAYALPDLDLVWSRRVPATGSLSTIYCPQFFGVGDAELGRGLLVFMSGHLFILNARTGNVDFDTQCPGAVGAAKLLSDGSLAYESDGDLYVSTRSQTVYLANGEAYSGGALSSPTRAEGGEPQTELSGMDMIESAEGETLCLLGSSYETALFRLDLTNDCPGRESLPADSSEALSGGTLARSANGVYLILDWYDQDAISVLDGSSFELLRTIALGTVVPAATEASSYSVFASPVSDDVVYLSWTEYPVGEPSHDVLCAIDISTGRLLGTSEVDSLSSQVEIFDGLLRVVCRSYPTYKLVTLDATTLDPVAETQLQIDEDYHHIEDIGTLRDEGGETLLLVIDGSVSSFDPQTGERVETSLDGLSPSSTTVPLTASVSLTQDFSLSGTGKLAHLTFNDDHTRLLVSDAAGSITLFDGTGETIWSVVATYGEAWFLALLPSGDVLAQGKSSESFMGQYLLIDGLNGSIVASSDGTSLIGGAWISQDGTSLIATSREYAVASLSESFLDGAFVISLDPEAFGVESQMYLARTVALNEERALFYDQSLGEYYTLPLHSTEELVSYAETLTEGHELTTAERYLYHLE